MASRKFVVAVEMGNIAMQTSDDIAEALVDVAAQLKRGKLSGSIIDANGNTVGSYCARDGRGRRVKSGIWAS